MPAPISPDDAVAFLGDRRTCLALAGAHASLGLVLVALGSPLPQWYAVGTVFFASKIVFDYQKCTLSYLECKARGVPRERGVLNAVLGGVVGLRELPGARVASAAFAAAVCWYFFVVRGQRLAL